MNRRIRAISAVLVIVAVLVGPLVAQPAVAQSTQREVFTTVDQVTDNPEAYYGQRVVLSGQVDELFGPRAFAIGGDEFLFPERLLVVTASPVLAIRGREIDQGIHPGDIVMVVGPVREFVRAEVERDLDIELDAALVADFSGRPAVIASSVLVTPRRQGAISTRTDPLAVRSVDEVTDDPEPFYGRVITVQAEVNSLVGPRSFSIRDAQSATDEQILVVTALSLPATDDRGANGELIAGAPVQVTGVVRPFDVEVFEQEIGYDLDDERYKVWRGAPAIIARSIQRPVQPSSTPPS